jgi:hypothetical protein
VRSELHDAAEATGRRRGVALSTVGEEVKESMENTGGEEARGVEQNESKKKLDPALHCAEGRQ